MSLFFYLITFAINLHNQRFVTAAVFVNNQHGIQQRGQDFDKTHKYTQQSAYTVTRIEDSVHLKCYLFPYLLNICRNLDF